MSIELHQKSTEFAALQLINAGLLKIVFRVIWPTYSRAQFSCSLFSQILKLAYFIIPTRLFISSANSGFSVEMCARLESLFWHIVDRTEA